MEINGRSVAAVETTTTIWRNREVCDWINSKFDGRDRDVAYTTLCFISEKFPEMKYKFGMESVTTRQ